MRFRFIQENSGKYNTRLLCRALDVTPSGYYAWRSRPASKRAQEEQALLPLIRAAVAEGRHTYGHRKVHALVEKEFTCGPRRIGRLMRENGLQPKQKRRYKVTTQSRHSLPIAPNLLEQDFTATAVNEKWVADITYIWTDQGWLYLSTIEDLFSRFIAGWAIERYLSDVLTRKALIMALGRRKTTPGLIHHSDRGSQYASSAYRALLDNAGIVQSMSRRANAYDNAPMESFYSRLKMN
jgi:putative transposase